MPRRRTGACLLLALLQLLLSPRRALAAYDVYAAYTVALQAASGEEVLTGSSTGDAVPFLNSSRPVGYELAQSQSKWSSGLVVTRPLSASFTCPQPDGFSVSFTLQLGALTGVQTQSEGFTVSLVDANAVSGALVQTRSSGHWAIPWSVISVRHGPS